MEKIHVILLALCLAILPCTAQDGHGLWLKPTDKVVAGEAGKNSPYALRLLNHWDNPDGTVERGYAGRSIFWKPDGVADLDIVREYGRANASIGINGTVLNNVNAKPLMLSKAKLKETKRIADALRPYGIKVYLSVNFASPKALGGLPTADPLDKGVKEWWKRKVKEIYSMIPDFGGFLVKANSEGEPGPMDYGRTHADGANMLADALQPHGGIVMWRAFVYSPSGGDRASQAYDEFLPLDGKFRDNVIIQIKNGPIDFQPREPLSPLFFAMKKTKMMMEVQITQEYTGESIHTCFAPFYESGRLKVGGCGLEVGGCGLEVGGCGSQGDSETCKDLQPPTPNLPPLPPNLPPPTNIVGLAGVANIGDSRDWCGSEMAQSNWYAFGRMAAEPSLSKETIAREWLGKTFTTDTAFVNPMTRVLLLSHDAVVRYMMPLGLHHIFAGGHHYGPEPWCNPEGWREDWKPRYYHQASAEGIGFNRTTDGGSGNTRQYPDNLFNIYNNVETCPEQLLLWFHHLPWTHRMHSGETLWDALCHQYDQGVREAEAFAKVWKGMRPYVEHSRHAAQQRLFDRQAKDAWWWRDACLLYFQQYSNLPFPIDSPAPRHSLDALMRYHLDMDNYSTADIDKLP